MNKNIILIGTNGSGKTTLANELYKKGYHYFKLSPLSNFNHAGEMLTFDSNHLVFDRWSVVDLAVYRSDREMFNNLQFRVEEFNKHNLVVYLHQGLNIFDGRYSVYDGTDRVVPRPDLFQAYDIDQTYLFLTTQMAEMGLNVLLLQAHQDLELMVDKILEVIKNQENVTEDLKQC